MRRKTRQQNNPERNPRSLALRSQRQNSEAPGTDLAAGPGHTRAWKVLWLSEPKGKKTVWHEGCGGGGLLTLSLLPLLSSYLVSIWMENFGKKEHYGKREGFISVPFFSIRIFNIGSGCSSDHLLGNTVCNQKGSDTRSISKFRQEKPPLATWTQNFIQKSGWRECQAMEGKSLKRMFSKGLRQANAWIRGNSSFGPTSGQQRSLLEPREPALPFYKHSYKARQGAQQNLKVIHYWSQRDLAFSLGLSLESYVTLDRQIDELFWTLTVLKHGY